MPLIVTRALLVYLVGGFRAGYDSRIRCSFEPDAPLDVHVFLSSTPRYEAFSPDDLVWRVTDFSYTLDAGHKRTNVSVPLGERASSNETVYAHIYLTRHGSSPDPQDPAYSRRHVSSTHVPLVVHGPRPAFKPLRNLLTGARPAWQLELEAIPEARRATELVPLWKPSLSINLVVDNDEYPSREDVPAVLAHHWSAEGLFVAQRQQFRPILFVNELEITPNRLLPLNASLRSPPLELELRPMSVGRFVWMLNLRRSFASQEAALGISQKESDELRAMFVQTNPYLLYATVGVSALHVLFDVLAFQSDLSFWRSVESMEGLSTRSVVANVGMEALILVYLVDEGASWLVQLTSGLSLLVGVFKIGKAMRVRRADKARAPTGGASSTDEYDRLAYGLLAPPLLLLVVGYAAYELVFDFHRSWAAWALNSAVALVYGIGFIVMTPQLFINYKLKSVAHLPWNFFFYKFLNTFIDDLFAFIIKMPALHRMSVFRDDIVFFAFLYQRYVYPVDRSRLNEFGQRGDADAPRDAAAGGARSGGAPPPQKGGGASARHRPSKSKKAD